MGKHSDFRIISFQVVDARRILQFKEKLKTILKSLYGFGLLGDVTIVTKLQTFVWICNHVSKVIT